jgi:hypothetical protein
MSHNGNDKKGFEEQLENFKFFRKMILFLRRWYGNSTREKGPLLEMVTFQFKSVIITKQVK